MPASWFCPGSNQKVWPPKFSLWLPGSCPETGSCATVLSPYCWKHSWSTSVTKVPATRPPTGSTWGVLREEEKNQPATNPLSQLKISGFIRYAKTSPQFFANSKMGSPNTYKKIPCLFLKALFFNIFNTLPIVWGVLLICRDWLPLQCG